jgi:exonuclease I
MLKDAYRPRQICERCCKDEERLCRTLVVTVIGYHVENKSEFYVHNLQIEPETLVGLSDDELVARLAISPKSVRRLRANDSPIIMPTDEAPSIASAAQLGSEELSRRADLLRGDADFRSRLVAAFQATKEERHPPLI